MEHVEVGIRLHLVEQINRQLLLSVSESTEVSKVTRFDTVRPLVTELGLILLGMVEGLHTVVGLGARVSLRAPRRFCEATHFRRVSPKWAPLILVVIVHAFLLVVATFFRARLGLE